MATQFFRNTLGSAINCFALSALAMALTSLRQQDQSDGEMIALTQ